MNLARQTYYSVLFRIAASAGALLPLSLAADTALVQTKANLRKDPSTRVAPIRVLLPDEELTILDATSSPRYLKVKTEDKKTGWVLRKAVEILPDANSAAPVARTIPPSSPGGISGDWPKPEPVDVEFEGSEGPCSGTGDGGDTATNARKNRTDPLPEPHDVPWTAIASLAYPAAPPSRAQWTSAQLASIKPFEGVAVRTTGFLTHTINIENTGSGESTNCHFHADDDVDWHIYLQGNPKDAMAQAVIVETAPRIRKLHQWDAAVLNKLVNTGNPIRVTGFLMLDPEHRNQVGKFRGTVWEIHPITNIEVCNAESCSDSEWVPLDQAK
jgi:uncharacterized protein YgiM (DUF1202 family)